MMRYAQLALALLILTVSLTRFAVGQEQVKPTWPLTVTAICGESFEITREGRANLTITSEGVVFQSAAEVHAYLDDIFNGYLPAVRAEHPQPFQTLEDMEGPSELAKEADAEFTGWTSDEVIRLIERGLAIDVMVQRNYRQNSGDLAKFDGKLLEIVFAHRFYFEGKRALTPLAVIPASLAQPVAETSNATVPMAIAAVREPERLPQEPAPSILLPQPLVDEPMSDRQDFGNTEDPQGPLHPPPSIEEGTKPDLTPQTRIEMVRQRFYPKVLAWEADAKMHNNLPPQQIGLKFRRLTDLLIQECSQESGPDFQLLTILKNAESGIFDGMADSSWQVVLENGMISEIALLRSCPHGQTMEPQLQAIEDEANRLEKPIIETDVGEKVGNEESEIPRSPDMANSTPPAQPRIRQTPPPVPTATPSPGSEDEKPAAELLAAPANLDSSQKSGVLYAQTILTWETVPGATSYVLYKDDKKVTSTVEGTHYVYADLKSGDTATFTVAAYNRNGEGNKSNTVTVRGQTSLLDQLLQSSGGLIFLIFILSMAAGVLWLGYVVPVHWGTMHPTVGLIVDGIILLFMVLFVTFV